jgi:hypothetical protein
MGGLHRLSQPRRNGITRPNMAVGWTWRNPNSASSPFNLDRGGRRLAGLPQQEAHQGRLALHQRRCPREAQTPIPGNMSDSRYCLVRLDRSLRRIIECQRDANKQRSAKRILGFLAATDVQCPV